MRRVRMVGLILLLSLLGFRGTLLSQTRLQVLLITGDDASPAHNWRELAETTRQVLVDSGKFEVRVSEDPSILESGQLSRYDLIFITLFNRIWPVPPLKNGRSTRSSAADIGLVVFQDTGRADRFK
jgi:hypothetical protein